MIKIKSKVAGFGINIPTDRKELTKEYFDTILNNVHLSRNHCVVALIYRDTLFSISNTNKTTVTVLPIIAKINDEDISSTGYLPLQQIILGNSELERGYHLYLNNNIISPAYLNSFIRKDKELAQKIINGKVYEENNIDNKSCIIYTVEFKIVPIVNIRATLDIESKVESPFKFK